MEHLAHILFPIDRFLFVQEYSRDERYPSLVIKKQFKSRKDSLNNFTNRKSFQTSYIHISVAQLRLLERVYFLINWFDDSDSIDYYPPVVLNINRVWE
jgi:hypothetical protein